MIIFIGCCCSGAFTQQEFSLKPLHLPFYDVILDNPFETDEDIVQTLQVIQKIPKPYQLQLFSLTFYKGTAIYDLYKKKFGDDAVPPIRNYFNYEHNYLNRLVRISPLISSSMTHYFITRRDKVGTHIVFAFVFGFATFVCEPISFLYLMFRAFKKNILQLYHNVVFYQSFLEEFSINFSNPSAFFVGSH